MRHTLNCLLLTLSLLFIGIGNVWGEEYIITFMTNSSDGSTTIAANATINNVIESGKEYVAGFTSNCSKAYYACTKGIKLGSSAANGTVELNLAQSCQTGIKSITLVSAQYNLDTNTKLTLQVGTTILSSSIVPGTDYAHTFEDPTTFSTIKISTSEKRAYISQIIITTEDVEETPEDVLSEFALYSEELTEGDYIIVDGTTAMKNEIISSRLAYSTVTVKNKIIINPDASIVWHISQHNSTETNPDWKIYNAAINKYAAGTGYASKATLESDGTLDKALWVVSGNGTYNFTNRLNTNNKVNSTLRYNNGIGFACYASSTGNALQLYKKVETGEMYTVTVNSTSGGIASSNPTKATAGTTIHLTASANTNYNFTNWIVTDESGKSIITTGSGKSCTFIMPASNVDVQAVFSPKNSHNVKWEVNGKLFTTDSYAEGEPIIFNTLTENIPDDYTFMGWTDAEIDGKRKDPPTYVTSAKMGNSDITYYAVFAVKTKDENKFQKGDLNNIEDGEKVIIAHKDGAIMSSTTSGTTSLDKASTTVLDEVIENPHNSLIWTISYAQEGFYIKYGDDFLYATATPSLSRGNTKDIWDIQKSGINYFLTSKNSNKQLEFYNNRFQAYNPGTNDYYKMDLFFPSTKYKDYCTRATPKHTVIIEETEHGKIEVFNGEERVSSGDKVDGGTELTLTVTADTGYELEDIYANGNSITSFNYTINDDDVVFSATFKARKICTVTWYVNGKCTYENYYEGDPIRFIAPTKLPESYVFMGWTDSPIENPNVQQTAPTYIKDATAIAGSLIFYAVFAHRTNDENSAVTYTLNNPTNVFQYQVGTETDDKGGTWSFNAFSGKTSDLYYYQLTNVIKEDGLPFIATPEFSENITSFTFKSTNLSSAEKRYILVCSNKIEAIDKDTHGELATITIDAGESLSDHSIELNGDCKQIFIFASKPIQLRDIAVKTGGALYSDYCTLVSNDNHQLYTVYTESTGNGTISVNIGNVEILSGTKVENGSELKVTANPESDDYKIESFIAQDHDNNKEPKKLISGNKYTIDGSDVKFSVVFREKKQYTVTFIMNGNDDKDKRKAVTTQREDDYMQIPDVPSYRNKVHFGWVTKKISDSTKQPSLANINNKSRVSGDATYYAVYATRKENANTTGTSVNKTNFAGGNYYIIDTYQAKDGTLNYYAMTGAPNDGKVTATIITDAVTKESGFITVKEEATIMHALMVFRITMDSEDKYTIKNVAHEKLVAASESDNDLISKDRQWTLKWGDEDVNEEIRNTYQNRATFLSSYDSKNACLMLMATNWDSKTKEQSTVEAQMFKDYLVDHRNKTGERTQCYGSGYLYLVPAKYTYFDFITDFVDKKISISKYGYTTYTNDIPYQMPENLIGRTVFPKKRTDAGYNLNVPTTYPAESLVPAGESLLLQGAEGDYTLKQWGVSDEPKVKGIDNYLYGEYGEKETNGYLTTFGQNESNKYYYYKLTTKTVNGVVVDFGWYWGNDKGEPFYMSQFDRAYLVLPKEVANNIKAWVYDAEEDNTETSIKSPSTEEARDLYDVSGRRVPQKPRRGIYIMNGKKILVK